MYNTYVYMLGPANGSYSGFHEGSFLGHRDLK